MINCHLQRLTEWRLNGCVNNDHLQATLAQIRRGQKELCQRGENERGEEKVAEEKRAFKGLENDKEIEWGSRRDNVSGGGGVEVVVGIHWKQTGSAETFDIFQVETADEKWQVQVTKGMAVKAEDFPPRHHVDKQRKWANITQLNLNEGGRVKRMKRSYCWFVEPQET